MEIQKSKGCKSYLGNREPKVIYPIVSRSGTEVKLLAWKLKWHGEIKIVQAC